jgi:hypothetical protein
MAKNTPNFSFGIFDVEETVPGKGYLIVNQTILQL